MIVYDNLWRTMKKNGFSQYRLMKEYDMSSSQITRLKRNQNVTVYTINRLCEILDCQVADVMSYVRESCEEQKK